jgi:hypothetical protein
MDQERTVLTYLRYFESKQDDDRWAVEQVDALALGDPQAGWDTTLNVINRAVSDSALAYIAAGPLEDLLNCHGAAVIGPIEQECLTNERLRLALSGVWIDRENPIWDRWYAVMWKYGFAEGMRGPL